jgi:uncharacterized zinc-type alcohol dehydrogenase-like protein
MATTVKAYGATASTEDLKPLDIERRAVGTDDVKLITYSGVCHSDIHTARNEWNGSTYPVVPGHEIIGRVVEVEMVLVAIKGDLVGVGCMVDSCQTCSLSEDRTILRKWSNIYLQQSR